MLHACLRSAEYGIPFGVLHITCVGMVFSWKAPHCYCDSLTGIVCIFVVVRIDINYHCILILMSFHHIDINYKCVLILVSFHHIDINYKCVLILVSFHFNQTLVCVVTFYCK